MTETTTVERVCLACGEDIDEGDATEFGGEVCHFWCVGNEDEPDV